MPMLSPVQTEPVPGGFADIFPSVLFFFAPSQKVSSEEHTVTEPEVN